MEYYWIARQWLFKNASDLFIKNTAEMFWAKVSADFWMQADKMQALTIVLQRTDYFGFYTVYEIIQFFPLCPRFFLEFVLAL